MTSTLPSSLLWLSESTVNTLLDYYNYPHPEKTGEVIVGYDKAHALRTAKMCAAVANYLGHDEERIRNYQVACLLHDLGRAGLDQDLFGKIWTWAKQNNIPTRPAEWRTAYPDTNYGEETEVFWKKYQAKLKEEGIETSNWAKEQVEMRLGYARRLERMVEIVKPQLNEDNIQWLAWMSNVTLYYYYPEKLTEEPDWVRQLGEILVACEQLEAYSNRERGSDYYNRNDESFVEAFNYLNSLKRKGQLGEKVLSALRHLTAKGIFDVILEEARGRNLSEKMSIFSDHSIQKRNIEIGIPDTGDKNMTVITKLFSLKMKGGTEIENITEKCQSLLTESSLDAGIVNLFIKHTTASIMIFEDEPGLRQDTKTIWDKLIPANPQWQHNTRNAGEDNGHSHLRGQIQGPSLTIPFMQHSLMLGQWQQIVVIDFDTCERTRQIVVQIIGE